MVLGQLSGLAICCAAASLPQQLVVAPWLRPRSSARKPSSPLRRPCGSEVFLPRLLNPVAMKGVILAGGTGSRLHPLTRITNKHLLPIYDRPMINYAIEALVGSGVGEIMLVTGGTHAGEFLRLLGNGNEFGIDRLFYAYQDKAGGIAEALGLAEKFVAGGRCVVLLADTVFERSIRPCVEAFRRQERGARVVL